MKFSRVHLLLTRTTILAACFLLWFSLPLRAQPMITSINPPTGASGVSVNASVTFYFNDFMDNSLTAAEFLDISNPGVPLPITSTWSALNTVLTCTPVVPFPSGKMIFWNVTGESFSGEPLEGTTSGFFYTGASGGTNRITTFSVGKVSHYVQSSTEAPILSADTPYGFAASTTLASNRIASAVTLTLPVSGLSVNLTRDFLRQEFFFLTESFTSESARDAKYQSGSYLFEVQSTANQQVPVNLSGSLAQPGAPFITNFTPAQSIIETQDFRLGWNPYPLGTTADYIYVQVYNAGGIVFRTPEPGESGALDGTATSVLIPAGTLSSLSSYTAEVGFYRPTLASINPTNATVAFRSTFTELPIATGGASGGRPILSNASLEGTGFAFQITASPGDFLTVEWAAAPTGPWTLLLTTNTPPEGIVRIVDPRPRTNGVFYRAYK